MAVAVGWPGQAAGDREFVVWGWMGEGGIIYLVESDFMVSLSSRDVWV